MSDDSLYEIRREAQDRGLRWADVADAYREVKALEWEKRQRPNEIRQHAWMMATASVPGCWPFWRHGFSARWGMKLAKGQDYTCVPGYDEIGQQIGTAFAEYGGDDGTEELFAFLFSPYDKLPTRTELYRKALELAERECRRQNAKLPSQCPANYKTEKGLFEAFVRALGAPISVNRVWWVQNAMYEAEQRFPALLPQFRRLREEASPRTLEDLIPVGPF